MNNIIENLLIVNRPINRFEFFKYTICMTILELALAFIFILLAEKVYESQIILLMPIIFSIFIILPLLYLYSVQFSKRLWDITKDNKAGLLSGIIILIISAIGIIVFPALTVAIYLTLILLPGKITVNE